MAFISNNQVPEDEKNKLGNTSPTTPNPIPPQTGGSSGTTAQSGGGASGAAPGTGTSTAFGSNAAKLSDYLKANKGQVQEFGNKIAGNLTDQYNQALGSIDTGFGNFNQEVGKGYTPYNESLINQASQNPNEFVKNPENVSGFKSQYNDKYSGPENFQSYQPYSDINNSVNKAVENAKLVGSESGLKSFMDNNLNTGQNTPGMKTLDTLLLKRSPEARTAIQQAAQPFQGLTDYLGQKTNAANENVANAKNEATQTSQRLQNQFTGEGGIIPSFQSDLNNRVSQARQQAIQQENLAKNAFASEQFKGLTPEQYSILGIDPTQWGDISRYGDIVNNPQNYRYNGQDYGPPPTSQLDLSTFLRPNQQLPEVAINSSNLASADDYARAQALSQLTGQDLSGVLNPANLNQAGTANLNLSQIDPARIEELKQMMLSLPNLPPNLKPGYVLPTYPSTGGGGGGTVGYGGTSSGIV